MGCCTDLSVGCLVMAAGNAERFGRNKLSAVLGRETVIERALRALPRDKFAAVTVVTQYPEVEEAARAYGFRVIQNDHPDWGISHTIRIGTETLMDSCDAILYQVADQPLLRPESVKALVSFWRRQPEKIAALAHDGHRGNPCVFPARFYPELLELKEDCGGSAVIRRHEEDLILLETAARELMDIDTPEAYRTMLEIR